MMYEQLVAMVASFFLGLGIGQKLGKATKELSDVLNSITKAMKDGNITPEELEEIKKEISEFLSTIKEFKQG